MKLLFFIHSLSSGGAERVTSLLANYWSVKGWDVTIVTITDTKNDFYRIDNRIQRIGLELDNVSRNPFAAVSSNMQRIFALRQVLKQINPAVAIGMMTTANCLLALSSIGLAVKTIGSERIYPPKFPLGKVWEVIRRLSYPFLHAIVAQTLESSDWLKSATKQKCVVVIPNPLNYPVEPQPPFLNPSFFLHHTGARYMLLAVGRLDYQKGFDRLIHAFSEISVAYPEWVLVILGEGQQRDELTSLVTQLKLTGQVYMPGIVGNLGDWYEAATIYVLTSRYEGFPNTLLEAMSYGVPSIAVDCKTGPSDIIHNEIDGMLVQQNDLSSLVEALKRLMSDKLLRQGYAKSSVSVIEKYSLESITESWERLFNEVVR